MFVFTCYYICPACGEGHTAAIWFRTDDEMFSWWENNVGTLLTVLKREDVTWLDPEGTLNGSFVRWQHVG